MAENISGMNIELLRQATKADHEAVENSVPLMGDGLTLQAYITVLYRIQGLVAAWEKLGEGAAPEWMQPMMKLRQRQALIEEDLRFLAPQLSLSDVPKMPAFTSDAQFLGAMYVMEGSRLGGAIIAKHVEIVLGFQMGRGTAFFRGSGRQTGPLWKDFLDVLQVRVPDAQADEVILAAQSMFRLFAEWMAGISQNREVRK
jgi:heme oxygenase